MKKTKLIVLTLTVAMALALFGACSNTTASATSSDTCLLYTSTRAFRAEHSCCDKVFKEDTGRAS